MNKLIRTGEKVNDSIEAVWRIGLTIKKLEELEDYINHQETVLPIVDPAFIQKHGFKLLDEAKKRIELLKPIVRLKSTEENKK